VAQRDYIQTNSLSANNLLDLINDILDVSKIEAGRLELSPDKFNLQELFESVADILAPRVSKKDLELVCAVEPGVPIYLIGDDVRLRQILINLAGNAIKFTERGEVDIRARLKAETQTTVTLHFTVRDTGIGIPKDKQDKIFEKFIQADGSMTRKFGGTGLGLAISKRLVEMMGGELGVESELGTGSTFWFTAVFEKRARDENEGDARRDASTVTMHRVLVADDNATCRDVTMSLLEASGCCSVVRWVDNGLAAVEELKKAAEERNPLHVLLLDLQMPGMNSREILKLIKENPDIAGTRVIIMASLGSVNEAKELKHLGAENYVIKPIKPAQVIDAIQNIPRAGQTSRPEETVDVPEKNENLRTIRILLAEDNPVNRKLAITVLSKAGFEIDAAVNGKEAVEAMENKAYDVVLMDVQMPEMDGFEATAAIRNARKPWSEIPILAMTAHAMQGDREKCLAAGMNDYLTKPIQPKVLIEAIRKWTSKSLREKEKAMVTEQKTDPSALPINLEAALERCGGDQEFLTEILGEFLSLSQQQLGQLAEALDKSDAALLAREAHSIKGAAANLGAEAISKIALELEMRGKQQQLDGAKQLLDSLTEQITMLDNYMKQSTKTGER